MFKLSIFIIHYYINGIIRVLLDASVFYPRYPTLANNLSTLFRVPILFTNIKSNCLCGLSTLSQVPKWFILIIHGAEIFYPLYTYLKNYLSTSSKVLFALCQ